MSALYQNWPEVRGLQARQQGQGQFTRRSSFLPESLFFGCASKAVPQYTSESIEERFA
jgi:hypothetical protein